jgi:WD40 repeat protein
MNQIVWFLSILIHSSFTSPEAGKLWISSCRLSNCQNALEMCVRDGCLGKAMCQMCIQQYSSECLKCVNEILSESEDLLGANQPTIFCDNANPLHQAACSYFCRTNYKTQSKCVVISDLPICNCEIDLPSTIVSSTTNKPISYPCKKIQLIFFLILLIYNSYASIHQDSLTGHTDYVYSLAVLPNGNLASGSGFFDRTIKIWDANSGMVKQNLRGHTDFINALIVLPNGDLASGSADRTIKIWNLLNGSLKKTLNGHLSWVSSLAVLKNGLLASSSDDKTIKIWNCSDGSLIQTLKGHTDWVSDLVVTEEGLLVSAGGYYDRSIKIWNASREELLTTLTGHTNAIKKLLIIPNGQLASASDDRSARIWDLSTGREKLRLVGHSNFVNCLAYDSANNQLITGSDDRTIKLWNLTHGGLVKSFLAHESFITAIVMLTPSLVASASYDKQIKIWKIEELFNSN